MDFNFNPGAVGGSTGDNNRYDVIIIGGGPAGSTAAIYTSRAGLKTLVLDRGLTAGALGTTSRIANYPGIPDVGGAELLEKMRGQARSFGAEYATDRVVGVQLAGDEKLVFGNGSTYTGRAVVIATGSMGRGRRVKGEDELLGRGVSYCATCDAAFFRGEEVVVAGSSDEAVEEALYLARFVKQVHFLCPTPEVIAPQRQVDELAACPNVSIIKGAVLREIVGSEKVEEVRYALREGGEGSLRVSGAFVYLQGGKPVTDFLEGQLETSETGCLVVDREFRTAVPGVYAVGDVLCSHVKQAVIAAGEGAVAGIAVEKMLRGREKMSADWGK
jgi:thioredoxin reductase (NADPH)